MNIMKGSSVDLDFSVSLQPYKILIGDLSDSTCSCRINAL